MPGNCVPVKFKMVVCSVWGSNELSTVLNKLKWTLSSEIMKSTVVGIKIHERMSCKKRALIWVIVLGCCKSIVASKSCDW